MELWDRLSELALSNLASLNLVRSTPAICRWRPPISRPLMARLTGTGPRWRFSSMNSHSAVGSRNSRALEQILPIRMGVPVLSCFFSRGMIIRT